MPSKTFRAQNRVKRSLSIALLFALTATIAVLIPYTEPAAAASYQSPSEVVVAITDNHDDAEELPNGDLYRSSGDLDIAAGYSVGLRFRNVCVDGPGDIASATIELTGDETDTATTAATITGHDIGNAPAFNFTDKIGSLPRTAAVAWDIPTWTPGEVVSSPDIAPIINQIVSRSDWVACNDIVIILEGTGDREARSHNTNPAEAPRLDIQLQPAPLEANWPSIDILYTTAGNQTTAEVVITPDLAAPIGAIEVRVVVSGPSIPSSCAVVGAGACTVNGNIVNLGTWFDGQRDNSFMLGTIAFTGSATPEASATVTDLANGSGRSYIPKPSIPQPSGIDGNIDPVAFGDRNESSDSPLLFTDEKENDVEGSAVRNIYSSLIIEDQPDPTGLQNSSGGMLRLGEGTAWKWVDIPTAKNGYRVVIRALGAVRDSSGLLPWRGTYFDGAILEKLDRDCGY